MKEREQRAAAKAFAEKWQGIGDEKQHSQSFWIELLEQVYGVENAVGFIKFEDRVKLSNMSFIDAVIPETRIMIEQKSLGKNLDKPIKQSDGSLLTPYQQAKRYANDLPNSKRPRFIVVSNFAEFRIHDMENPHAEPEIVLLKDLPKEYYRLEFLVNPQDRNIKKEMELSLAAGDIVGKLYDALRKQYKDPDSDETQKFLNKLCVRLVFCLYAEDAGIFGKRNVFCDYLSGFKPENVRNALIDLFEVLATPKENRDPYMKEELAAFDYVNGGLFADTRSELLKQIPQLNDEILQLLLKNASRDFDWSSISPTIFGAVFESTLNPDTRRKGGMHYTSIPNIHKVIDPLFLDELNEEFEQIKDTSGIKKRKQQLLEFQTKISKLTFLDPACGSGNFLTESYISLRRLENKILKEIYKSGEMVLDLDIIKVSISQFYGIEINDFAVTVAKTALWIAESQAMQETENIIHKDLYFLPLKSYSNIIEGNALRMDWGEVAPKENLSYIMGNPPFVGYSLQSKEQKADMLSVYVDEKGKPYKKAGKIDYVSAWYFKGAEFVKDTDIKVAFVSTNSITQGEQVADVWKPLYERFNINIDFAHRTFRWDSESTDKAAVHVVIIGFSNKNSSEKKLFSGDNVKLVKNINPYLIEGDNIFVESRKKPISDVPEMITGNRPADGGNLIIEAEDYEEFIKKEPKAKQYIKKFIGAVEFINQRPRYCLWLVDVSPSVIKSMPLVKKRIEACREDRLKGAPDRQKLADTPALFRETLNPENYVIVPCTSSENRKYVPIDFMNQDTIASNALLIIPDATLYHFGVLTSNVHMAWMRAVGGRLKSDYRYSKDIVYNNFPWPTPTDKPKAAIEQTAQGILDARAKFPNSSLADLYDETLMPPELRKAHQANDKAVMAAYGFDKNIGEEEIVAELMKMYQELTEK